MEKQKILVIGTFFSNVGGAELIAYNTFKLLKKENYEVYFWSCNKGPFWEPNYPYIKNFTPYNKYFYWNYIYNCKAARDLRKFIKKIKPDLIHLHNFISYLSPSILDICKNIPTIMTLHDSAIICPAVTVWNKYNKLCEPLECKNKKFYNCLINGCCGFNIEKYFRKIFRNYIISSKLENIDHFITPSRKLRELVLNANIGIKEDKITAVNNFLTTEEINSVPNYLNNGYFLYIGRLSKEKGVDFLLKVFNDLPKNINLHIVGGGPEEAFLKKYVKDNDLRNVKLLGFKNREEIKEEYKNCIATILPCNWFENFPTTIMESFINGKPVIASNLGGIPEQIEHNNNGLLFTPLNIDELKNSIMKYWENNSLVKEHGENAYKKAKNHYTEYRYLEELVNIYNLFLEK